MLDGIKKPLTKKKTNQPHTKSQPIAKRAKKPIILQPANQYPLMWLSVGLVMAAVIAFWILSLRSSTISQKRQSQLLDLKILKQQLTESLTALQQNYSQWQQKLTTTTSSLTDQQIEAFLAKLREKTSGATTTTTATTSLTVDNDDWLVYSNEIMKFSFRYPPTYQLNSAATNSVAILNSQQAEIAITDVTKLPKQPPTSTQQITLNGQRFFILQPASSTPGLAAYWQNDSRTLLISFEPLEPLNEHLKEEFYNILTTFKTFP